jgi:hypothetical protein
MIGNSPTAFGVKLMITGFAAARDVLVHLELLDLEAVQPSPDRTIQRTGSPTVTVTTEGSNSNRRAMTSMTRGSAGGAADPDVDVTDDREEAGDQEHTSEHAAPPSQGGCPGLRRRDRSKHR